MITKILSLQRLDYGSKSLTGGTLILRGDLRSQNFYAQCLPFCKILSKEEISKL